jgi:DNA-binding FadR family transcriptional regulator
MAENRTKAKRSRAELVAADVEDEILEGRMPVGSHLGRRSEFMVRFGISPTIMNETLRILRDRGLVGVRPGAGGGVFVASQPPQVRLGGMDLWFVDSAIHPLDLFEARLYLEDSLAEVAFDRADERDISIMQAGYDDLERADDARAFLEALLRLHRSMVSAARVSVLDGMHQTIIALLQAGVRRAVFIDGYQPLRQGSLDVHRELLEAIRHHDRTRFQNALASHRESLVRADDPRRSPAASTEEEGRAR